MQRFPSLSEKTASLIKINEPCTKNKASLYTRKAYKTKSVLFYQQVQKTSPYKVDMFAHANSICCLKATRYICHRQIRYVPLCAKRENGPICTLQCNKKIIRGQNLAP